MTTNTQRQMATVPRSTSLLVARRQGTLEVLRPCANASEKSLVQLPRGIQQPQVSDLRLYRARQVRATSIRLVKVSRRTVVLQLAERTAVACTARSQRPGRRARRDSRHLGTPHQPKVSGIKRRSGKTTSECRAVTTVVALARQIDQAMVGVEAVPRVPRST